MAPEYIQYNYPSFKLDEQYPGTETAKETPASLAASSILFVGGGIGDKAKEVTYSTKNPQGLSFGTGGQWQSTTTTTTVTAQYNYGASSGEGARKGGLLMGFGDAGNAATYVTYSSKVDGVGVRLRVGTGKMATTIDTTETQYGVVEGDEGLLIGIEGSGDTAWDITY